ncbi:helix-turn-helix domain-containing protein [Emticicia agri]|uniref:Helix-turn-helix domain-containing protein n=1 Tax=Emticicia agri TaxID=2492393 RepID=A0A4Q5LYW3_9BACT|nr:helix-turn-helix domain-containing protein [Emticicia agri]RYU95136.1 helix-turn-helix domain-containing protein [Emticicia agri]
MRAKRYIKLEPSEVITMEEGYKNATHHQFKQRCHCLLLSHQGYDMYSLKSIFQVSHPTITNWFDSWETHGIVGLRNQLGQGRKPIFNAADESLVKSKVKSSPQTLKKVRQELKEALQKDFSQRTLERFLKTLVEPVGKEPEKV